MTPFSIVGKRFSPSAFADYAANVPLDGWRPSLVVLHNTAVPTLRDRPSGFSEAAMQDLRHYYAEVQGWSGGPHLFVDQGGIWVFNPLDRRGVHSPSWNAKSWGVEMLGDFASEPFDAGDGLKVRENAIVALTTLFRRLGLPPDDAHFRLHKEDPKTTHDCPGRNVAKEAIRTAIQTRLHPVPSAGVPAKVVVYRKGGGSEPAVLDATLREGAVYADATALAKATGLPTTQTDAIPVRPFVGDRFSVTWNPTNDRAYLVER